MISKTSLIAAAIAIAFTAGTALAQQEGLVNVNVTDVTILEELNLQAPITVQAPIGIAANVCGVSVVDLRRDTDQTCEAKNASGALGQAVSKQILDRRSGGNQ